MTPRPMTPPLMGLILSDSLVLLQKMRHKVTKFTSNSLLTHSDFWTSRENGVNKFANGKNNISICKSPMYDDIGDIVNVVTLWPWPYVA